MYRSRGQKEKTRQKKAKARKTRKERNKFTATFDVAVNFGCFYYTTGVNMRFLTKSCPPIEVCATNIYGNSPLKYTEGGDKTSQYSYLVVVLSNWVPDSWVYRLPTIEFQCWPAALVSPNLENFGSVKSGGCSPG